MLSTGSTPFTASMSSHDHANAAKAPEQGPDNDQVLDSLNAALRFMEQAGVALNASQLLQLNHARLTLYLKTKAYIR